MRLNLLPGYWYETKDGDDEARMLFHRHYSHRVYKDGRNPLLFCGPGAKLVLLTAQSDALFVWRKFISMNDQTGINCAVFRNESKTKSSILILEACDIAWNKWPGERLYTYVNPRKIRSVNPGYCFKQAGFKTCGKTKKGLIILEKLYTHNG
jgi:hypothetical protein